MNCNVVGLPERVSAAPRNIFTANAVSGSRSIRWVGFIKNSIMTAPKRTNGMLRTELTRMCAGKNRYPDVLTASAAGAHYIEIDQLKALWWYRCPVCKGIHLTKTNHGKRQNVMYV